MPERVQLSRKAGWRMPPNTVKVSRPGIAVFTFLSFLRMDKGESAVATFLLAETLTVLSAVAQVIHTLNTSGRVGAELIVACTIAALPPLVLSATSYFMGRTLFKKVKRVTQEGTK